MNNRCVTLGSCLRQYRDEIWVDDSKDYGQITVSSTGTISHRGTKSGGAIGRKRQFVVNLKTHPNTLIFTRQGIYDGAIGFAPPDTDGCIATENMPLFSLNPGISREYIEQLLLSPVFKSEIKKLAPKGAAQKSIHERELMDVSIPLPSLESQIAIAEAVAKERQIVGSLQHEITHQQSLLAKLKQAILQEAIQGKLTADWRAANPDVEPASQLLHRIQAEKARLIAAKKIRPEKPLPKITPAEIPFEIPKGWEWCLLEELVLFTNGKAHEQIVDPKGRYVLVNSRFVSTGGVTKKFSRAILTPISIGDLALVMSDVPDGRALGRCFLVDKDDHYTLNQRIGALRMLGQIDPMFAFLVLDRNRHFLSFNDGKKQTNLMKREILSCPFPLPPLAEQAAIVERVEALMTTCRALEAEIEQARTHAAHLLQAVLKEAFAPARA
ncbi:MAG: hypothetical protein RL088_496 [Verrucomicrobiota bacterium]|jgi:type I restriction enzyme S subunit